MTRSELIALVAKRFPQFVHKDVELAANEILAAISATLAVGDRVEIRGFGSFSSRHRPARIGRNPKTGEPVAVPQKRVPYFKAGQELLLRVQPGIGQHAAPLACVFQPSSSPSPTT